MSQEAFGLRKVRMEAKATRLILFQTQKERCWSCYRPRVQAKPVLPRSLLADELSPATLVHGLMSQKGDQGLGWTVATGHPQNLSQFCVEFQVGLLREMVSLQGRSRDGSVTCAACLHIYKL